MTVKWEDLSTETRRTIEGVHAPTQDERNGAHPRRCEMALNEFAPEVALQLQAYARALLKDAAAPYEVPMRMARSRTKPSNPAFRALAWVFSRIADWRREWIEGPYQTVGSDGTLLLHGAPVCPAPEAVKLGVAGKRFPDGHRRTISTDSFVGRFKVGSIGRPFDVEMYAAQDHCTFAFIFSDGSGSRLSVNEAKDFTDLAPLVEKYLSSRPNAPPRGDGKRWGVWVESGSYSGWLYGGAYDRPNTPETYDSEVAALATCCDRGTRYPRATYSVREYV